jgi:hypothetical protein
LDQQKVGPWKIHGDFFTAEKLGCTERKHGEFIDVRNFLELDTLW